MAGMEPFFAEVPQQPQVVSVSNPFIKVSLPEAMLESTGKHHGVGGQEEGPVLSSVLALSSPKHGSLSLSPGMRSSNPLGSTGLGE